MALFGLLDFSRLLFLLWYCLSPSRVWHGFSTRSGIRSFQALLLSYCFLCLDRIINLVLDSREYLARRRALARRSYLAR